MRWLSAAPTADPSTANDPLAPTVHKLLPSTFVFVLPRPLPNAQLSLSLYVTNSARCVQQRGCYGAANCRTVEFWVERAVHWERVAAAD